ncbi:hypothetical protein FDECE_14189 [Fusarium decemcellulare]|nr:hypothetical protein FDECE_14189 [Fusarium decemcellulare]
MRFDMLFCIALGASVAAGAVTDTTKPTGTAKKMVKKQSCSLQTWCGGADGGCPAQGVFKPASQSEPPAGLTRDQT